MVALPVLGGPTDRITRGGGSVKVNSNGSISIAPLAGQHITVTNGRVLAIQGDQNNPGFSFANSPNIGLCSIANGVSLCGGGADFFTATNDTVTVRAASAFGWPTVRLYDEASDVLAQRRSTNAQTFRLYSTYTDASNYERLRIGAQVGDRFLIAAENAGTGSARGIRVIAAGAGLTEILGGPSGGNVNIGGDQISFTTSGGSGRWVIGSGQHFHPFADNTYDFGTTALRVRDLYQKGRSYLGAPATAPTDGTIAASGLSWWVDEAGNTLTFRVKYAGGTLKTGTVALT